MAAILGRELNLFERIERRRQAILATGGLVEPGQIQTIIAFKIRMIFLGLCSQVAEEIEDYQRQRTEWERQGYRMWSRDVEAEATLKKNYAYFLEIVEPYDLRLGFLAGLNPHDSVGLLEEYQQLGRRVWFTIQIHQTIKTFN